MDYGQEKDRAIAANVGHVSLRVQHDGLAALPLRRSTALRQAACEEPCKGFEGNVWRLFRCDPTLSGCSAVGFFTDKMVCRKDEQRARHLAVDVKPRDRCGNRA